MLAVIRSYEELADALATQRRRSGLSLELVARRAGFGADVLRRLEEKKQFPGVKLTAWMAALGVILSLVDCDEHAEFEPSMLKNSPENYRAVRQRVAAKGGRWRAWTLSKRRRRLIARKAGLASAAKRREERLRSGRCNGKGEGSRPSPSTSPARNGTEHLYPGHALRDRRIRVVEEIGGIGRDVPRQRREQQAQRAVDPFDISSGAVPSVAGPNQSDH
jgi:hypothetical protein